MATARPTPDDVMAALEAVNDPHVPVSLRRMGMLRDVTVGEDGVVTIQLCIPCLGCPGVSMLHAQVREAVMKLPGVTDVRMAEGWHLPWSREMIEPDVRDLMRVNGIQI